MAVELPVLIRTYKANADLSAKQFSFVKFTADNTVDVCSAVTDKPCGVLQNKPTAGQAADVMVIGVSKVLAGGTIAAGDAVGTDATGKAIKETPGTDTTHFTAGQAEVAAASGDTMAALIDCASIGRAA